MNCMPILPAPALEPLATPQSPVDRKAPHAKALRIAAAMAAMSFSKRVALWRALTGYVDELGLLDPAFQSVRDKLRNAEASPAGPDLSGIPVPPMPHDINPSKRRVAAWAKGCEARRNHLLRSDCRLTGAESIAIFERGWDAMNAAVAVALAEGRAA